MRESWKVCQSAHREFMKEAIVFTKGLEVFDGNAEVTGRIKCLKGWQVTLNAIILIWEHLKTTRFQVSFDKTVEH